MRIFYTKNKQTDFFVFVHFDQKTKNKKWNEPDNRLSKFELSVVVNLKQISYFFWSLYHSLFDLESIGDS